MEVAGGRWWGTPRFYVVVTIASSVLASLFFLEGYPTLIYDSLGYHFLSAALRDHGLSAWPSDLRTYGYALFLAAVSGFREVAPKDLRLIVFCAQLVAYLWACAWVGRRLARVFQSPGIGALAYAIGALNPLLLLHASEVLTDELSAVLILLGVALSWRAPGKLAAAATVRDICLSFFCAAAAVAVRPANVVVVAALAIVWVLRALRWRDVGWSALVAALAGLIPPFVPQFIINYRMFGTLNPLIEQDLYRQQTIWGMATLKYGTLVVPDHSPYLVYANPFFRGDPDPAAFLRHHPVDYLATLGLHAFGMLDQDLPFTYVTNLDPWYRWPIAVENFLLLYLSLASVVGGLARLIRRRVMDEAAFVLVSTLVVAGAYAAIYLPVLVESRFGLALEALTIPLVARGFAMCPRWRGLARLVRTMLLLGAALSVLAGVSLSAWMSATRTNPRTGPTVTPRPPGTPTGRN